MNSSLVVFFGLFGTSVSRNLRVSLLDERKSDTVALGKSDEGLLALANAEDIAQTGGEGVSLGVLDVDDLVGTGVVLNVHEHANTTDIVSALHENLRAILKLHNAVNLASLKVKLNKTNHKLYTRLLVTRNFIKERIYIRDGCK